MNKIVTPPVELLDVVGGPSNLKKDVYNGWVFEIFFKAPTPKILSICDSNDWRTGHRCRGYNHLPG